MSQIPDMRTFCVRTDLYDLLSHAVQGVLCPCTAYHIKSGLVEVIARYQSSPSRCTLERYTVVRTCWYSPKGACLRITSNRHSPSCLLPAGYCNPEQTRDSGSHLHWSSRPQRGRVRVGACRSPGRTPVRLW